MRSALAIVIVLSSCLIGSLPLRAQDDFCQARDAVAWNGLSRYNILVLGMDSRPDAESPFIARPDAIMLVSFDPQSRRLGILDIPRDLFFAVQGLEQEIVRVNTLIVKGEQIQADCGFPLMMSTLEFNLGLSVDAVVAFDFMAFIQFVDAIGGVTMDVPVAINDPQYPDMTYGVSPLVIPSGEQTMNGETALAYARTRHGDDDYARGERQLAVILAIREQLGRAGAVQDLLDILPDLIADLDGHIYSNLTAEQLAFLGLSMMTLDRERITTGSINKDYTYSYAYAGERVRVPDREILVDLLTATFGDDYWR